MKRIYITPEVELVRFNLSLDVLEDTLHSTFEPGNDGHGSGMDEYSTGGDINLDELLDGGW